MGCSERADGEQTSMICRVAAPGGGCTRSGPLALSSHARYYAGLAHGCGEQADLMESEQTSLDSGQFLGFVLRRGPWIVVCVVLVAAVAYGYSKHKTKTYTATAALTFNTSQLDEQIAGLSTSSALTPLAQQASNLELVKLGDMAAKTASLLGDGLTEEDVSESVSASAKGESSVVFVAATSKSPRLAAEIANTYSRQFVQEQAGVNRQFFRSALALVKRQLESLSPAQRFGTDGLELIDRQQTLSLLVGLNYGSVKLAQEALVPSSPSSPRNKRNAILGAVLGLLLGVGIALLFERFDRRIRKSEELEAIYRLPLLGVVPKSAALSRSARRNGRTGVPLPAAEAEAFSLVRAHLRFFNVDRELRTVAIASPAPGDGKTTVALHLAEAAARLGSRVLLLEIDLRHPTLAERLDVSPGSGVAGLLVGDASMEEATQSVALMASPGEGITGRTLDVLVAGAVLPPNPGELLESRAIDTLLTWAKSTYDLVVIDTPPLNAVSDAFPLLTKVDGVVIVGWVGHSRRDAAEQLQQVLAGSGAPLLGVIANGSKPSDLGSYAKPDKGKLAPPVASDNGVSSSSEQLSPAPRA